MWEEGDGHQENTFVKRKVSKVLRELQWKAQGTMLPVQSERPPFQGKEQSGPLCDMMPYIISYAYYDIVYDIICDFLS